MNPEEPILETDFEPSPPPPQVKRHSVAYAASQSVQEMGLEIGDDMLDDSWSVDDFSDLLPDHH